MTKDWANQVSETKGGEGVENSKAGVAEVCRGGGVATLVQGRWGTL